MVLGGSEEYTVLGPWGFTTEGYRFEYQPQGTISEIAFQYYITNNDADDSIDFISFKDRMDDGAVSSSPEFGQRVGIRPIYKASFVLGEYITGMEIMLNKHGRIRCLWITTNSRTYSPFGVVTGERISVPIANRNVVGFFGHFGGYLHSLGVCVQDNNKVVKSWTYLPQGLITKITIAHTDVIHSLVFESKTSDGVPTSSQRFGGTGGQETMVLISSEEFITEIDVIIGDYDGQKVINYMSIHTNVKTYGPFGTDTGLKVSFPIKEGSIIGFSGLAGMYLNTFDIYEFVQPKGPDKGNKVVKSWTYMPDGLITKIVIMHGDIIHSLTFESKASDGGVVSSPRFGGPGGISNKVHISSGEFITGIDVIIGEYDGQKVIKYMSIDTNVTTYGPFGTGTGSKVSIPIKEGSIVGFTGLAGMYLNTFGIFEVIQPKHPEEGNKVVKSWTYLPRGLITKIVIMHGDIIDSLVFESKTSDGVVVSSPRFGGPGGTSSEVLIKSREYITKIDMMVGKYYGQDVINLLTIHTNIQTYGPFGNAKGSNIEIPIKEGSVVGFSGFAGMYLNTFDIFEVAKTNNSDHEDKGMSIGPLGGPEDEGKSWIYKPQGGEITQIIIRYGAIINYIIFQSKMSNGALAFSERFGHSGGTQTNKITFGPGEYITGIEVMLGDYSGVTVVYNLSIRTNVTTYGPFGTESGTRISIPITDGRVLGFFGRSATYLNAIGVYTIPKEKSTGPFQANKGPLGGKTWDECIIIGPWGGSEGTIWAYRPTEFITKIEISYGSCIDSLTFHMTSNDGTVTKSRRFGGPGGSSTEEVTISTGEYITGVDVMVGNYDGQSVITLLSLRTNITMYGPFGTVSGSKITIPIEDGSVVGFYGRSGSYLNSIGIFAVVK